jgi:hypothetical protein
MKHVLIVTVAAVLLGTAGRGVGQEPGDAKEGDYYPLAKDNAWIYAGPGGMLVNVRVVGHDMKKIGNQKEMVSCARLETSVNSMSVATEHVAVLKEGPAGPGIYRVAVGNKDVVPPLCFLKLPPKKGEKWAVKSTIGDENITGQFESGEGQVKVPFKPGEKLKTVTAVADKLSANGQPMKLTYHFVAEVGIVMQQLNVGGVDVKLELTRFERKEQ